MMVELTGLIERLRTATGPDRELDNEIARECEWPEPPPYSDGWAEWPPHFTRSVDAALALVEKVLPGRRPDLELYYDQGWDAWQVTIWPWGAPAQEVQVKAKTLPLAILLALLTALQSKATSNA